MRWIDKMNERANLMGRMMETIGAMDKMPNGISLGIDMRTAAARCKACECTRECALWLQENETGASAAPEMCPNADLFAEWLDS
jgi:hypothetical protein